MAETPEVETILIVDDSNRKREEILRIAQTSYPNARVIQATSPLSGLAALRQYGGSIDLVLTDLSMTTTPNVTYGSGAGHAVTQAARHFAPSAPVFVVTADSGMSLLTRAIGAGANGAFGTPYFYNFKGLREVVDAVRDDQVVVTGYELAHQLLTSAGIPGEPQLVHNDVPLVAVPRSVVEQVTSVPLSTSLFRPQISEERSQDLRRLIEMTVLQERLSPSFLVSTFREASKISATDEARVNAGLAAVKESLAPDAINRAVDDYLNMPPQGGHPVRQLETALLFDDGNELADVLHGSIDTQGWMRHATDDLVRTLEPLHFHARKGLARLRAAQPGEFETVDDAITVLDAITVPDYSNDRFSVEAIRSLVDGARPSFTLSRGLDAGTRGAEATGDTLF